MMMKKEEQPLPKIVRVEETDSTNNYLHARANPKELPEGSVVWADFQTAGRGQIGNAWESEAGANLTFSAVLYPSFLPANRQFLISQIAALSVKQLLDKYTGEVTIKWPNDIYWRDRKICGMLIENDLSGMSIYSSIIGIGININQKEFRSNAPNPVSLYQITGREYDLEQLMEECDVLTFHVPLIREGAHKTFHLADADFFSRLKRRPIIANTVKGFGSPVMEDKAGWHHHLPNQEEYAQIVADFAAREEALNA